MANYFNKKVGLFDADIHGPSLPTLVKSKNTLTQDSDKNIYPIEEHNVKCMS